MASTANGEKVEEEDFLHRPQAVKMDVEHDAAAHHCRVAGAERDQGASD